MTLLNDFVLPRPGAPLPSSLPTKPIPAPSEKAFVETFGQLLPPAKYLNTNIGKAAYYDFPPATIGSTTGTPERVLLIHGVQTPALGMLPLTKALRASFPQHHFVLLDLWGHGLSEAPVLPYEKGLFHQLIDNLLDHLTWPAAHFVGFSFGGMLTAGYAGSRPSRVQSFTLVAPAGLIRTSGFSAEQRGHVFGQDELAARKQILEFLEGGELVVPADWKERVAKGEVVAEAVREWQMREHAGHTASVVAIFRDGGVLDNDADFTGGLRSGKPNLVVLGGLDDVCSEKDIEGIGYENVYSVPQAGHGVVRERVPEVAASITEFWKKLLN